RVFQYHGAEHKTVYTFEANEDLTVENARTKSTLHPRCGTSFLMFVMAISILVFSLVPSTMPFAVKFLANGIVDGTSENTRMEMAITNIRKLVPQRGWSVDLVRAFSTVKSSFASKV